MVEQFENNGDTDQTQRLGLNCLPVTRLGVSSVQWVKIRTQTKKYTDSIKPGLLFFVPVLAFKGFCLFYFSESKYCFRTRFIVPSFVRCCCLLV